MRLLFIALGLKQNDPDHVVVLWKRGGGGVRLKFTRLTNLLSGSVFVWLGETFRAGKESDPPKRI